MNINQQCGLPLMGNTSNVEDPCYRLMEIINIVKQRFKLKTQTRRMKICAQRNHHEAILLLSWKMQSQIELKE